MTADDIEKLIKIDLSDSGPNALCAHSARSLKAVESYMRAREKNDTARLMELLADEVAVDTPGTGHGMSHIPKAHLPAYYGSPREGIELVAYKNLDSYAAGNTVAVIGQKKERSAIDRAENYATFVCIFTLELGLISKIDFLKKSHVLYNFFISIVSRCNRNDKGTP